MVEIKAIKMGEALYDVVPRLPYIIAKMGVQEAGGWFLLYCRTYAFNDVQKQVLIDIATLWFPPGVKIDERS